MPNPRPIEQMRRTAPPFLKLLGGEIAAADPESGTCRIDFNVGREFCHSGDVVQGGFPTAMLDAAMSHAVFAQDNSVIALSSLEISTRYLEVTRAGPVQAHGRIVRVSYKTAFLEGELRSPEGLLLATAHTVAKLGRRPAEG